MRHSIPKPETASGRSVPSHELFDRPCQQRGGPRRVRIVGCQALPVDLVTCRHADYTLQPPLLYRAKIWFQDWSIGFIVLDVLFKSKVKGLRYRDLGVYRAT